MRVPALCVLAFVLTFHSSGAMPFGRATVASPEQASEKFPVPVEQALLGPREAVRAKFADKIAKATVKKDFMELSQKLLELATSLHDDPIARYATLLEAHAFAVKGRDCELALGIVEKMHAWYAPLDRDTWRRGVVLAIARDPRLQAGEVAEVASAGLEMLEACLGREEAQPSAELWEMLRVPIRKLKEEQAQQRYARAEQELGYVKALETLKTQPDDGGANFVVGWNVAFVKDRLLEGMELLARASDEQEALRRCARLDLQNPTVAAARVEAGDAWASWARSQDEPARGSASQRAEHWYFLAHRQSSGLDRARIADKFRKTRAQAMPSSSGARAAPANEAATEKVGEAIERALRWLAQHQSPDGRWSGATFARQCQKNDCGGPGKEHHDTGLTGLALLCFLRAGETHESRAFGGVVKKGLEYLLEIQKKPGDGCFGQRIGSHWVYNHACATIAMVEAYGSTRAAAFKEPAQKALNFVQAAQNPYAAWRYSYPPDGDNDSSVTGWMVTALSSARSAGLKLEQQGALANALGFIDTITNPASGRTGYTGMDEFPSRQPALVIAFPPEKSESLTAVGMVVRCLAGRTLEGATKDDMLGKGADLLTRNLPLWSADGSIDFYYWYYGTLAMRHVGGARREKWNEALRAALLDHQRVDEADHRCGSWDPVDAWSPEGGRVYATVLNCLSLETYYRQLVTGH